MLVGTTGSVCTKRLFEHDGLTMMVRHNAAKNTEDQEQGTGSSCSGWSWPTAWGQDGHGDRDGSNTARTHRYLWQALFLLDVLMCSVYWERRGGGRPGHLSI